ncbi:L-threonylcarbamoyladenylate synthase [Roseibaca sp. V10]|uniref:Threonylcarbamoyl-AMP synthase n=1 Tax=Roseinatronobacter domitianus TaxID=2940293 RepID=A0ABT0M4D2_9RHOB|nr:L-threonylcarbamoyladenylate synthase [Roseibaca domitiana]MCL1629715.1 L-threonylcarbamoyladenylate synthase [Roseibaca domitiana]
MENPTETAVLGPQDVGRAAQLLRAGRIVAIPTETVYGLAGDARNAQAVAAIFAAKGRPAHNPLIVHLASLDAADRFADLPAPARKLAHAFWPGALTLVAPLRSDHGLAQAVTAGLPTVALRVPAHPLARALLAEFGGPVAAPSANPSGRISPTNAAHVMAGLGGRIAAVLDGGPCPVGVESTILGFEGDKAVMLREGGISAEQIAAVLGQPPRQRDNARITAPGQMLSHYAPQARVRLNVSKPDTNEVWIGFGPNCAGATFSLSPSGDLGEAAANLFSTLHKADAMGRPIAIAPVPDHDIGAAINDRLRRAAAPRV